MKRPQQQNDGPAGALASVVSVVLFLVILWALGAFGDAADLWARIRT